MRGISLADLSLISRADVPAGLGYRFVPTVVGFGPQETFHPLQTLH